MLSLLSDNNSICHLNKLVLGFAVLCVPSISLQILFPSPLSILFDKHQQKESGSACMDIYRISVLLYIYMTIVMTVSKVFAFSYNFYRTASF